MNDQSTYTGPTAAAKLVALVKTALNSKADKTNATKSAAGLMSAADKTKMDGLTAMTADEMRAIWNAN